MSAYDDIRAERERQVAKGRDAAYDDKSGFWDWLHCLDAVEAKLRCGGFGDWEQGRRTFWIKVGAIAVGAVESHDSRRETWPK